jgi:hypothetical protein
MKSIKIFEINILFHFSFGFCSFFIDRGITIDDKLFLHTLSLNQQDFLVYFHFITKYFQNSIFGSFS